MREPSPKANKSTAASLLRVASFSDAVLTDRVGKLAWFYNGQTTRAEKHVDSFSEQFFEPFLTLEPLIPLWYLNMMYNRKRRARRHVFSTYEDVRGHRNYNKIQQFEGESALKECLGGSQLQAMSWLSLTWPCGWKRHFAAQVNAYSEKRFQCPRKY